MLVDLSDAQIALIAAWARDAPGVTACYLFGSRAKGTSRPDSDVDLAVEVETVPGLTNKNSFDQQWLDYTSTLTDLDEDIGLRTELLRLSNENPKVAAAVGEHGILIYRRDRSV